MVDKIKEIYSIIYDKINLPKSKLIGKEFVKGIFVEMVKQRKISWAWNLVMKPTPTKGIGVFLDG